MSVKIYISSHKDFSWCPADKEYTLVCGENELKDKYPIDVIEEHPTVLYKNLHDSYAELTRLRYIQMNIKPDADYIGFCQYKRYFTNISDVEEVMKHHDAILPAPVPQGPTMVDAYGRYHQKEDLIHCMDIIKKNFPDMSDSVDEVMKSNKIHANNMFVMKRKDFYKYCYFLFNIFDTLNRENGWKTMDDIKRDKRQLKTHGFLAERISNVFFVHYFKSPLHRSIIVKR